MKLKVMIWLLGMALTTHPMRVLSSEGTVIRFDFCGSPVELTIDESLIKNLGDTRDLSTLRAFCDELLKGDYRSLAENLADYRSKKEMDDWLFYQFVRYTAQQISPKANDYYQYTIYKWFLLQISGYSPVLRLSEGKLLFYVQSNDRIYNIPYYLKDGLQFVCLNYHDYGNKISFEEEKFEQVTESAYPASRPFSYRITHLPEFTESVYQERNIAFQYHEQTYQFRVRLNPLIKSIFVNYPSLDYGAILNIPLSKRTYETLIPILKSNLEKMPVEQGVDYLMRFTRQAFLFETDQKNFGMEKRMTPEQTLLYEQSDCEDRVALFYCLVKEIYNLPMIVLSYPDHVTIAVKLDKTRGKPILYNGEAYTICEPTPQKIDLPIGHIMPGLKKQPFEVVYNYTPRLK
jgi:hypothetical protein